jgi:hypothetical protein
MILCGHPLPKDRHAGMITADGNPPYCAPGRKADDVQQQWLLETLARQGVNVTDIITTSPGTAG